MRKFFPLGSLLLAAMTVACSTSNEPDPLPAPQSQATAVSVDAALSNLRSIFDATQTTRAGRNDVPSFDAEQVQILTGSSQTRSGEGRNLAYLVNFEQGGYAILGADTRQAPLIALAKNGSVTPESLLQAKAAVESGQKVDAPTLMKASMLEYLNRKVEEEPRVAAQTRALPVTIKEFQDSLLKTMWSPAEKELANMSRTKIALAQMMLYNGEFRRYYPTMIRDYVLKWSLIGDLANRRHITGGYISILLDPLNAYVRNDASPVLSCICTDFLRCSNSYNSASVSAVNVQTVRQMIFVDKKPTVACFEGMTMEHEGWVMDGWMKMVANGVESNLVHCKFAKDYDGSDDGYFELSAISGAAGFTQKMLSY